MKLNAVHHIAIINSDYEKTVDFYVNKLGLPLISDTPRPIKNARELMLALADGLLLELVIMPTPPKHQDNPEAAGMRHLAFKVDSVPAALEWLHSRGIKTSDLMPIPYSENEFVAFFWDPDGTPLELHE